MLLPSHAQAQVWQNGGVDNGNYNQPTNWTTNTVPDTAGETATFANNGTTAVTVTLGPISPQSWTFAANSQNYTVSGQAVNFVSGITNNANAGQSISISNNMTGSTLSQAGATSTLTVSGTSTFTSTTVTAGTLANSGSLTTDVNNSSTFNNSGTLTGTATSSGTFGNTGTITGAVTITAGTGTNSGALQSTLDVTGGSFQNNAGGTITGLTTNNGGSVTNNGGTFADVTNTTGTFTNTSGNITGPVSNAAIFNANGGQVNGAITNTGAFTVGGTVTSDNTFDNNGTGTLAVTGGNYTGMTTITNNSTAATGISVSATRTLSAANIANSAGSTISNSGTLTATTGPITNSGTITDLAGSTLNGGLTNNNAGVANMQGTLNGAVITNNTSTFNVTGALTGDSTFTTNGTSQLLVSGGNYTGLTTITNNSTAAAGGIVISAARTLSAANIANSTGSTISNSGILTATTGPITNSGTITDLAGSTLNGGLTNNNAGVANMQGTLNGAVITNNTSTFNVTGALTGNSTFTTNGTSQLLVSGGNYTGLTTITNNSTAAAGGIVISATRTLSAANISNSAGAQITNGGTLTATGGPIANAGTLQGLSGSTINGGLTQTSGTANLIGTINGAIINNGVSFFTVNGTLVGDSTFTNNGTSQLAVAGGDFTGLTTVTNNSTNVNGVVIATGRTLSAANVSNSTGAFIQNFGTLTSTIDNAGTLNNQLAGSVITGNVTNSGTVVNNGTTNGAFTQSAGILTGTGNTQNLAVNGGTFAPGNGSAGSSMTVTGSLAMQAAAAYLVQVDPSSASFVNVTGAATLGGATVQANFANGSYVSKQYTIVTAGSISGTFNPTVANTNLPSNFHTTLSYDATHAYLNLELNFAPPSGQLNVNQQNVANAIVNFFNTTGSIPLVFSGLTPAGLTQISGEGATATQQTTFNAMNQFMGLLTDPFVSGRGDALSAGGGAAGHAYEAQSYAAKRNPNDALAAIYTKAPPVTAFAQRWSVWAAGYGGSQRTGGSAVLGSNDTRSSIYGTAVGLDYRLSPDTLAGFALAGGGTNFSVSGLGTGRSDLFQAGAFLRHNVGPAYFTGALAYGWQDVTTDRTVTIAGIDQLRARFNANAWSGRLEGGYRFVTQGFGLTPYAAGQFTSFELPVYAEQVVSGANTFALAYNAKTVTATRSELGLRSDKSMAMQDGVFTLRGRLAWAHDYNADRNVGATFQTLPGASFVVNGARPAPDSALATASAEWKWLNGWSAAATFEGEFSNVTRSYAGKGVVRYAW